MSISVIVQKSNQHLKTRSIKPTHLLEFPIVIHIHMAQVVQIPNIDQQLYVLRPDRIPFRIVRRKCPTV